MPLPYKLTNTIQNYAWGKKGKSSCIPRLAGITPEEGVPYAEWWMGVHPKATSIVHTGREKIPLDAFIAAAPDVILGREKSEKFSGRLPFLFKVLSAGEALSIQTHPNKEQAEKLHAKDPEHYPDDNHKPEIAIALSPMKALAGFLPPPEMLEMLSQYPEIAGFIGDEEVRTFREEQGTDEAPGGLRSVFERLMRKGTEDTTALERSLGSLETRLLKDGAGAGRDQLFLDLKKKYGTDIGLFSIYFLNYLELVPGEAIFTGPGIPHAYLEGDIVECMANSDNVVRAGLTPKFKDIDTLLNIVTYEHGAPEIMRPGSEEAYLYPAAVSEFAVLRIDAKGGGKAYRTGGPSIVLVTSGEVQVAEDAGAGYKGNWQAGESWFLPAGCELILTGTEGAAVYAAKVP